MNDTVKRIMGLVDDVIAASHEINHDYTAERQVLEAELLRLFTPLTDEQIYTVVRSVQPDLSDTSSIWGQIFGECKYWIHAAQTLSAENKCSQHPKAPHGFDRNSSHSAHRYVCECESWEPYDAGFNAGFQAGMKAEQALYESAEDTQEMEKRNDQP